MEKLKLRLKEPVEFAGEKISELEFRKPKGKDLRGLPTSLKTGDLIDLAGTLCARPTPVMDSLSAPDTMEVLAVVADFIQGGQKTGANV